METGVIGTPVQHRNAGSQDRPRRQALVRNALARLRNALARSAALSAALAATGPGGRPRAAVPTRSPPREEGAPRWREVNSAALAGLGAQRDRPAREDQGVLRWRA